MTTSIDPVRSWGWSGLVPDRQVHRGEGFPNGTILDATDDDDPGDCGCETRDRQNSGKSVRRSRVLRAVCSRNGMSLNLGANTAGSLDSLIHDGVDKTAMKTKTRRRMKMTTNDIQWLLTLLVLLYIATRLSAIKHILECIRAEQADRNRPLRELKDEDL